MWRILRSRPQIFLSVYQIARLNPGAEPPKDGFLRLHKLMLSDAQVSYATSGVCVHFLFFRALEQAKQTRDIQKPETRRNVWDFPDFLVDFDPLTQIFLTFFIAEIKF
eukprot:Phypoly_transcript_18332.p1 GENE.Phypoly_transcript_18332~~Phypoly_transcript_18332.p1  ORF type:complete len:108 (+),score=2.65 Phypoly_transcript_18332:169-492(+)